MPFPGTFRGEHVGTIVIRVAFGARRQGSGREKATTVVAAFELSQAAFFTLPCGSMTYFFGAPSLKAL